MGETEYGTGLRVRCQRRSLLPPLPFANALLRGNKPCISSAKLPQSPKHYRRVRHVRRAILASGPLFSLKRTAPRGPSEIRNRDKAPNSSRTRSNSPVSGAARDADYAGTRGFSADSAENIPHRGLSGGGGGIRTLGATRASIGEIRPEFGATST